MSNVVVKEQFKNLSAYLQDGDMIDRAIDAAMASLTPGEVAADNLALSVFNLISTTKAEVSDNPGARPLLTVVRSNGALGYVHLHDVDADSVTEGVDANFVIPVAATAGEVTVCLTVGKSWRTFWDTGLTISSSTTVEASSAMSAPPDVWMLHTTS